MTWVAPADLQYVSLCFEAVVMIGLNPESLKSWIAIEISERDFTKTIRVTYQIDRLSLLHL